MKAVDVDESTGGVEIGSEMKRRKTGKSQAHLASQEGKDVREPLASRTPKKTKVESSFSQVPVTASVHGSLGSSGLVSQPPLGPSGRNRSKQKTSRESVERERRARLLSFFSLFHLFTLLHLFLFLLTSGGFLCSPSASLIIRRVKANLLVTTWYVCSPPFFFVLSLLL